MGFEETRWSRILLATNADDVNAQGALEELCATYWHPIYSYIRRRGYGPHDAEDLTQELFSHLLKKKSFANADPAMGRFRNFLMGALIHLLSNHARKAAAKKRGGGKVISSINTEDAEQQYLQEPDPSLTPEQVFDRRWTAILLQQALKELEAEFESAAQLVRFRELKIYLTLQADPGEYDRVAKKLEMTPRAVSVAVHRMRQRFQSLVKSALADTVTSSEAVELEFRDLFVP